MIPEDLKEILDKHAKWLRGEGGVRADLTGANLADADLTGAYLTGANLAGANLTDADLTGANLAGADLTDADLTGANLADADLAGANLAGAYLTDVAARILITPEGDLIGWKRVDGHIVKLRIPTEARRSNGTGRKCRAEWVEVLEIDPPTDKALVSNWDHKTEYRVGARVEADSWDENRWNECSHGIHFFITRVEAEEWR